MQFSNIFKGAQEGQSIWFMHNVLLFGFISKLGGEKSW